MKEVSSISRAIAALLFLIDAAIAIGSVFAREAPPKVIRLAGPGNAEAKPFSFGALGGLEVAES